MPVIVYKTMDLDILYVQGRRILCDGCRQPFTYVYGDRKTVNVTGIPIVSSDDGMRQSAMKKAATELAKLARAKNPGQALCPHRKRYQSFMIAQARKTAIGCGFFGGLLGVGALAIAAGIWFTWSSSAIVATTIAGAVIGLVGGLKLTLTRGPHRDAEDQTSMKDEDIPPLLERCTEENCDPFLFWYLALGNEPGEKEALISLGVYDVSGRPPIFPRDLSSDVAVRQLQKG